MANQTARQRGALTLTAGKLRRQALQVFLQADLTGDMCPLLALLFSQAQTGINPSPMFCATVRCANRLFS